MKNLIKIGLADNNKDLCAALREYISLEPDMKLEATAYNGLAAVEMISKHDLDVLILDITMPYLDGIGVLEKINRMNLSKRPKIIIITAIEQENIVKKLFGLGIDYYLIKPFTIETLLDRIRQFGEMQATGNEEVASYNTVSSNIDIDTRITRLFHEMGIPVNLRGYTYLREAIIIMLEDYDYNWSVTKNLYPQIAKKFHCSPSGVESAIRYILDMIWKRGNRDFLSNFFNINFALNQKQPTSSHFLTKIIEHLRMTGVSKQNMEAKVQS